MAVVERLLAAQVDDVGRGAGELGEGHQVMHALGFHRGWPALVMLTGVGLAGGEQFLAALGDQRFIFTVGGDNDAKFLGQLERAIELGIVDPERTLATRGRF